VILGRTASGALKIKTDGGLRAVSCGCCEPPPTCCMYPAQALLDGLYTTEDLPVELLTTFDGVYFYNMIKTGDLYPAYTAEEDSSLEIFIAEDFFSGEPAWHTLGGLPYGNCLVDGLFVKDNFAGSYTIQRFPWSGPFIVERASDCQWQATVDGTLYFGNPDNPPATGTWTAVIELHQYYFEIVIVWTNNDPNDFYYPNQLWRYSKLGAPTEPNSSPSGNYSGGEFGEIAVS
jgi:hypothetical protein